MTDGPTPDDDTGRREKPRWPRWLDVESPAPKRPRWPRWLDLVSCLAVVIVIGAIAVPNLIEARKHRGEAAFIGALKTINTSQTLFREGDEDDDGVLDYGNLQELSNATLIDGVLGSGTKQGYRFDVRPSPTTPEFLWFAVANPVNPGETGDRYLCTNHAGVIYYTGSSGRAVSLADGGVECSIPPGLLPVGK